MVTFKNQWLHGVDALSCRTRIRNPCYIYSLLLCIIDYVFTNNLDFRHNSGRIYHLFFSPLHKTNGISILGMHFLSLGL